MKKKIISIIAVSMIFGSVVSAASIWGTYKGNQVIRITSNGDTLKTTDVPAISYNGRTMIPISMLGQVGLSYKWDQKNQTVDVSNSPLANSPSKNDEASEYAKYADFFYELQALGQSLTVYSGNFNTAFNYAYMSVPDIQSALKIIDQVDYTLSTVVFQYNSLNNQASNYNDASINSILNNYYNSIESIKKTKDNLKTLLSDKSSTDKFNTFSQSNNSGFQYAMQGISASSKKYKEYINKIK